MLTVKEHRRTLSNASNTGDEQLNVKALLNTDSKKKREKILICQPDAVLIRKIYLPLKVYVQEIEEIVKHKTG